MLEKDHILLKETLLILLLSTLLASCTKPVEIPVHVLRDTKIIEVNPTFSSRIRLSDVYEKIRFIRLETSDNSRIDEVTKLIITSKNFIIGTTQNILIFKRNGDFNREWISKMKISRITDIYVDTTTMEIDVFDAKAKHLHRFDSLGNLINEWNIGLDAYSMYPSDKNTYCFYSGNAYYNKSKYKVNFFDLRTKRIVARAFPINPHEAKFSHFGDWINFYPLNDRIFLTFNLNDTIYSISKDSIGTSLIIDYGKYKLAPHILKKDFSDVRDFLEYCKTTDYAFRFYTFLETDNYIVFGFEFKRQILHGYYFKDSESVKIAGMIEDDLVFTGTNMGSSYDNLPKASRSNDYYTIVSAHEFIAKVDSTRNRYSKKDWDQLTQTNPDILSIYKHLKINDNPILMIGRVIN